MASKVSGLMCLIILCVHGASLPIKPPKKEIEPARKLLAEATASGPITTAVVAPININETQRQNQKHRAPLLSPKLMMIIVPSLFSISVSIIYIFCRRNPNNAELSAAVPDNITCNFCIIGALFSAS